MTPSNSASHQAPNCLHVGPTTFLIIETHGEIATKLTLPEPAQNRKINGNDVNIIMRSTVHRCWMSDIMSRATNRDDLYMHPSANFLMCVSMQLIHTILLVQCPNYMYACKIV